MPLPETPTRRQPAPLQRILLVACLFVLDGLGAWRVEHVLSEPPAPRLDAASFDERRLTALIDTVAGPGQSEVRMSLRADQSWSILVLLNSDAATEVPSDLVYTLIGSAFAIDPISGDEIAIRRVPFARPAMGALAPQHMVELTLILLAAGCVAGALLSSVRPVPNVIAQAPRIQPAKADLLVPETQLHRSQAARTIHDDPARAASIVRGWLRQGALDA